MSETLLRQLIREQIQLDEGIWDNLKSGLSKLVKIVGNKFRDAASWGSAIKEKLSQMSSVPSDVSGLVDMVKAAQSESGEEFPVNDAIKDAKQLSKYNTSNALQVAEEEIENSIRPKVEKYNESQIVSLYNQLNEIKKEINEDKQTLNEAGLTAVIGISLGILGGLPLLFKGLMKLANFLGANKVAELLKRAYTVAHHIEEKAIDVMIPDALSYVLYKMAWKKGFKTSKKFLDKDNYKQNVDHAKTKIEGVFYKAILIFFAWQGLQGALHAGASLLGFAEGTATTVKGIELAKGAAELANLAKSV